MGNWFKGIKNDYGYSVYKKTRYTGYLYTG